MYLTFRSLKAVARKWRSAQFTYNFQSHLFSLGCLTVTLHKAKLENNMNALEKEGLNYFHYQVNTLLVDKCVKRINLKKQPPKVSKVQADNTK